jgi:hypothetical protein
MFMSTLINDRAHPMVALPPGVTVAKADMTGRRSYRSGDVRALDLPTLCKRLIAAGCRATHLQVYDATKGPRVPMTFMSIADTAAWADPEIRALQRRASAAGPSPATSI